MKKILLCFYVIVFSSTKLCSSQNLVPNPSFEEHNGCPTEFSQPGVDNVTIATGWSSFGNTSDYYNACDNSSNGGNNVTGVPSNNQLGFQYASSGNAYCGVISYDIFYPYSPEYIGTELITPLIPGTKYYASIKINCANKVAYAVNGIGISFSTIPYFDTLSPPISFVAKIISDSVISDTLNWVSISGSFIADSVYKYLIVGKFFSTDTLRIVPLNYYGNGRAYYNIDDVCVTTDSSGCDFSNFGHDGINNFTNPSFNLYPNPSSNTINISSSSLSGKYSLKIYNLLSQQVKQQEIDFSFEGSSKVNIESLASGYYQLMLVYGSNVVSKRFVKE